MSEEIRPFSCTACGQGVMQLEKPKTHCCVCGALIYFNVDPTCDVECGKCTSALVESVNKLEEKFGAEIREFKKRVRKVKKKKQRDESLGIIRNSGEYQYALELEKNRAEKKRAKKANDELREARKKKGWSQESLSLQLGCSKSFLCQMERGHKPLNSKALEFIESESRTKKTKSVLIQEGSCRVGDKKVNFWC
jgi:ribosome-binding protein aMBF1 (putative translation factor)